MRAYVLGFAILAAVSTGCAERSADYYRGRPPDECGNPMVINQSYIGLSGKVVGVPSGDRLMVELEPGNRLPEGIVLGTLPVHLVGLEAPSPDQELGRQSKARLEKRLLGKRVTLSLSPVQTPPEPHNVMVELDDSVDLDENIGQVEAGLAKAIVQGPYDVDWWERCHLQKAQERARAAHLGIWGSPAS